MQKDPNTRISQRRGLCFRKGPFSKGSKRQSTNVLGFASPPPQKKINQSRETTAKRPSFTDCALEIQTLLSGARPQSGFRNASPFFTTRLDFTGIATRVDFSGKN